MLKIICLYGFPPPPISIPILIYLFVERGDNRNSKQKQIVRSRNDAFIVFQI